MGRKQLFCARCGSTELSVYYPTPIAVAHRVMEQAQLDHDALTVLEPSAGTGALARLAAERVAAVDCVELQPAMAAELKHSGRYRNVWQGNFLTRTPTTSYDRVVMNPPFEHGADMAHVAHALAFLKPGGLLVAIISAMTGLRARKADAAFAQVLSRHGAERTHLPDGAFREVGTNAACDLIRLDAAP